MESGKTIGWLLIVGALGVLIPYTLLTTTFEYPDILRQDTGVILNKFHQGGGKLILTWLAFALAGLPLFPAYILIGQKFENQSTWIRVATKIGVIGLIVQMIGLLRWSFVVPVLSNSFVNAQDDVTRGAAVMAFKTIHQFAGVLLGEHLGQLFTIIWTIMISVIFLRLEVVAKWISWLGIVSAIIYLMAQAELLKTVIPDFPVWDLAGFIGSTLWLAWLIIVGVKFVRVKFG